MLATLSIKQLTAINIFLTFILKQATVIILFVTELNNSLTAIIKLITEYTLFLTEKIKFTTEINNIESANKNIRTSTPNERKEDRKAAYNMVYIQLLLMAFLRKFRFNSKVSAYLKSTGITHATKYIPNRCVTLTARNLNE